MDCVTFSHSFSETQARGLHERGLRVDDVHEPVVKE